MEDKPKCPRCGNTEFWVYLTKFGYKKYMCKACKKSFQSNYLRKEATKGVQCPKCGSTDILRKGFNRSGIQKYSCKTCKKYFLAEYRRRRKPKPKPKLERNRFLSVESGKGILDVRGHGLKTERNEKLNVQLIHLLGFHVSVVMPETESKLVNPNIANCLQSGC
jgi:transposase-like protein